MDLLDLNDDQVYEAPQVSSYTPWRAPHGAEMGLLRRRLPQVRTLPDLQHRHPDFKEVAMDAHFHKWAGGSQIRSKLYELANKSDDYDAADELFSSWNDCKQCFAECERSAGAARELERQSSQSLRDESAREEEFAEEQEQGGGSRRRGSRRKMKSHKKNRMSRRKKRSKTKRRRR